MQRVCRWLSSLNNLFWFEWFFQFVTCKFSRPNKLVWNEFDLISKNWIKLSEKCLDTKLFADFMLKLWSVFEKLELHWYIIFNAQIN